MKKFYHLPPETGWVILGLLLLPLVLSAQKVETDLLKGMKPRNIGPAGMSGRVTALDVVLTHPDVIYAGTASGGLWKSESGGTTWTPIFENQKVASIGDVAIYQKNPSIVYIATGEGNPRNSQTNGNGVYKSMDGGKTWTYLGLENSRNIHRVIIQPDNPDIVYLAGIGSAWRPNEDRGVFKTTDGGKTWKKVLYINEGVGCAELRMDPENPNKLIAAMWEYQRWPWYFNSGGPASGIYITYDGGETWDKKTTEDGLPKGNLGRIGIAISPANTDIVYAYVESEKTAIYRSNDGGETWARKNDDNEAIKYRPFYYGEIYPDPVNENRLYNIGGVVSYSEDGGNTFQTFIPPSKAHPDHHAFWIHPENPGFIIDGNDGGMVISHDRGKTWKFVLNLPVSQFYHISVDMDTPYNVYGGLQDNGVWMGPSEVYKAEGIRNYEWQPIGYGDGFDAYVDKSDPRYGYSLWQGGNLMRFDKITGLLESIRPVHPEGVRLRFNWNAGMSPDPFDDRTIYLGSQFLHKSTDRGNSWEIISPDLTTNNPEKQKQLESGGLTIDATRAENYTTITAIEPSALHTELIWVGTDDGNVQITRDDGKTWINVIDNIRAVAKDIPEEMWVQQIRASAFNEGEAYVVFDNHRKDDWTPYVFKTTNYGKTWTRLVDGSDVWGYTLSFVQDPVEPNLMFTGTEFGLYLSIDGGDHWNQWPDNYPTVSTMDMVIHPREHDLVIGTFGRSVWILDNIQPLRELARQGPELLSSKLYLFEIPDVIAAIYGEPWGTGLSSDNIYQGENSPEGATITYIVSPVEDEKNVMVEILNGEGNVIRTLTLEAKAGINRLYWDLKSRKIRLPDESLPEEDMKEESGFMVTPGKYTVKVTYNGQSTEKQVKVVPDRRLNISEKDLNANADLIHRYEAIAQRATKAMDQLRGAEKTIDMVNAELKNRKDEAASQAKEQGNDMKEALKQLKALFQEVDVQGVIRESSTVSSQLQLAGMYLNSVYTPPVKSAYTLMGQVEKQTQSAVDEVNNFFKNEWKVYGNTVNGAAINWFEPYDTLEE